jgi:hypothetical protein
MEYTARIHIDVARRIRQWGLSDYLLVEVYLALREDLAADPVRHLYPDPDRRGGAFYVFDRVDPESRRWQHVFLFRVYHDQDEKTLHVVHGAYWRRLR